MIQDKVVVATILRAGLALHDGILSYFDEADSAFISAYRKHEADGSFHIHREYVTCPDLNDATLIICDPMLATGASFLDAIEALKPFGTWKRLIIASVIASEQGVSNIVSELPEADLWLGAVDPELNAKAYIVPGLGDAGDLSLSLIHI